VIINRGFEMIKGVLKEVFLALPFNKRAPQGTIVFHEGFQANGEHR
jgi:hypothetical protein